MKKHLNRVKNPENTNLRGSITVQLICLFCLVSAASLMLNYHQLCLFSQIQTCQTGGQPYIDTSPTYGECSLVEIFDHSQWLKC